MLSWLDRRSLEFPPLERALREPAGLLAAGGDLSPQRLMAAYRHGCFPWYSEGQPILWWSPDPRMVLFPEELHVSRSLEKVLRRGELQVSFDQDFAGVISRCAELRRDSGTWITDDIQQAYIELHRQGIAHSVETWRHGELVGGLYGIAIGRLFFGESMFSQVTDASKVAFVHLVRTLRDCGYSLIDCQMHTSHLASLGARPIARQEFRQWLQRDLDRSGPTPWRARHA